MSTGGTQQDLVNLLDICRFQKGFMKVFLQKAIFHFSEIKGGKHVSWNVFKRDEKATQLLKSTSFHSTESFQHLVLQISPSQVIPEPHVPRITPLDLVEDAPFIRYQQVFTLHSSCL